MRGTLNKQQMNALEIIIRGLLWEEGKIREKRSIFMMCDMNNGTTEKVVGKYVYVGT